MILNKGKDFLDVIPKKEKLLCFKLTNHEWINSIMICKKVLIIKEPIFKIDIKDPNIVFLQKWCR